jgi:hypothetical protein
MLKFKDVQTAIEFLKEDRNNKEIEKQHKIELQNFLKENSEVIFNEIYNTYIFCILSPLVDYLTIIYFGAFHF